MACIAEAARFELSPSSGSFRAGCDSAITIMMSTESAESDAANIIVNYNPSEIEILDANPGISGTQIQQGSTYDIYADNTVIPSSGIIRLTGFSIGHAYNSGSGFGNFGTILFRSLPGVGSTSLTIDYTPGGTTDSNIAEYITSDDLLTGVTDGSYTFEIGPCFDDTRAPWVTDPNPAPGSDGNPLDSNVTFHIQDNQSGVDITSVRVNVQGVDYTYDGVNRFTHSGDAMDYFITVDPITDFPDGVMVRVQVDAEDLDNNVMSPYRWFFNEPPVPPPVPPTCEELGCPTPEECITPEEVPECVEPEVLEIPETTVEPGEMVSRDRIEFWASRRTVRLFPDSLQTIKVLTGTTYSVLISRDAFSKEVEEIWWYSGASSYRLAFDAGRNGYWTDIGANESVTAVPSHIIINYSDGTTDVSDYIVQTVPYGWVYEQTAEGQAPVDNAKVTVYKVESPGVVWNAGAYYQSNPDWTAVDGQFGFYVPQGYYYLTVEKPGYETAQTATFYVRSSIINSPLQLEKIPEPVTIVEEVGQAAALVGETITDTAEKIQAAIADFVPEPVEEAADYIAPAAVGLALLNLGTAVSLANLLPFLYGLITQPLLLLGRRKRKKWGVVYNSLTKMPIDLAVVRLVEAQTGRVIRTRITDKDGRYFFMAKPGLYKIEVRKPGFIFPTVHLRDSQEDFQYIDIYHGEIIKVSEASRQITANIPLDPVAAAEKPKKLIIRSYLRRAQKFIASLSVLVAFALLIINPSWFMLGYFIVQLLILALFWRLARPPKPKGWGIVYDKKNKKPIANAIVRVFDSQFNKLLETQVTDPQGKYSFLVGNNQYYTTYEKPGYLGKKLAPIDYRKMKEKSMIAYDVGLQPQKNAETKPELGGEEEIPSVKVAEQTPGDQEEWREEEGSTPQSPESPQ